MLFYVFVAILTLTLASYLIGWRRSLSVASGRPGALHSRPGYYGAYVAAWVGIPALLVVLFWLALQGPVIDALLLASLPSDKVAGLSEAQADLIISEIKQISRGNVFGQHQQHLKKRADEDDGNLGALG